MYGEARNNLTSSLRRLSNLNLTRTRHARTLHDLEGIEETAPAHIDTTRVERRILLERRAFDRQEAMVRKFHRNVDWQRARLAAHKEANRTVLGARLEYMVARRERLLPDKPLLRQKPLAPPRRTPSAGDVRKSLHLEY